MNRIVLTAVIMLNAIVSFSQNLSLKWETDTLFLKPESALYNPVDKVIYISNINGDYLARDGNGFISKIDPDGKIEDLKWCTGLDNPQGLGFFRGNLYVADIDRVVRINVKESRIEKEFKIEGAQFLNDITIDKNGDIYVSDCRKNKIYRISDEVVKLWSDDPGLSTPNGLLCTDKNLFILNMGRGDVFIGDKAGKQLTLFCEGIKNCDGIVSDGKDGYFISGAWQGQIFHLNAKGEKRLVLDLGEKKIITADIEFIPEHKLLIIPTLDKTVLAYKWE
ncbi:SMP-30/gluconolactonase/LRE family protein [Pararcticibacter amylolyticus]|uniref:ATP-binding protein n=1 Tax=Pararcticibacter amylolyticus TaxID=2173175 RepID=A0A2U2PAW3_9SPHI|nr:ATP-binding protein [Pararcticibacter amylolyticus]PWG78541.1 ATP-binding protein [Pararcticibacter amylolyticus]